MSISRVSTVAATLAASWALATLMATAAAQAPPINGVTGTIALEGTIDAEQGAANTVIVKTKDGVKHAFHVAKDLLVHGKKTGEDAFTGLKEGTTVVVHYTMSKGVASAKEIDELGDNGLQITEGVVTRIDRQRQQLTIRFENGTTETLRLTKEAAADAGQTANQTVRDGTRVVVYYANEAGQKVAHFFRKAAS